MREEDIEERLVIYIRDELQVDIKDRNQDLVKEGAIDSFNMIQLLQFIEDSFKVSIDIEELDLDSFKSVKSIAEKINEWKSC